LIGTEGIEILLDDTVVALQDIQRMKELNKQNKELEKNEYSEENKAPSETTDELMKARQAYHLPNFYANLAAMSDLSTAWKNFTNAYTDQVNRLHGRMTTMSQDKIYEEMLRTNKGNTRAFLKVVAKNAGDICD
jgi:hypothetical protein